MDQGEKTTQRQNPTVTLMCAVTDGSYGFTFYAWLDFGVVVIFNFFVHTFIPKVTSEPSGGISRD